MAIPTLMLNDDIKVFAEYSEYLEKIKDSAVTEEVSQSEEVVDDEVDSEETKEDAKEPLVGRRPTGVVTGGEARRESDEEGFNHTKKLKGLESLSEVAQFYCVTPYVLDEPSDCSSSYSSDSEEAVEDISSDEADDTVKADEVKKADIEKETEEQVAEELVAEKQTREEKHGDEQADVYISDNHTKKPEATKVSSSMTLSSAEFMNQFLNDNPDVNVNEVLKYPVEPEVQSMVDIPVQQAKLVEQRPPLVDTTVTLIPDTITVSPTKPPQTKRIKTKILLKKSRKPKTQVNTGALESRVTRLEKTVNAMSWFNLLEEIDKSVKAHLKYILPKDLPDFGKIKLEKPANKSLPKYSTTPFDQPALDIYDPKDKLFKMMRNCKAYNRHPTHKALYDALAVSLNVDEDDMDKQLKVSPVQKK
ncbi:hypothetical protein Tco_1202240 [Tanacetum coccineum]